MDDEEGDEPLFAEGRLLIGGSFGRRENRVDLMVVIIVNGDYLGEA